MDPQQQDAGSAAPSLCVGGCGFYGRADTNGFCSVCYKAHQSASFAASSPSHPAAASAAAPAPEPKVAEPALEQPVAEAAAPAADAPAEAPAAPAELPDDKPVQPNRSRCFCCRKKVGLLGFECRCGYVFCSSHRHAADHACTFDYATFDKANLAKQNNKVVAAKVEKL